MTTSTQTLAEFLTARLDEDETAAHARDEYEIVGDPVAGYRDQHLGRVRRSPEDQRRVREVEAKRRIVAEHPEFAERARPSGLEVLNPRESSATFCEACGDPYFWDQTPPVEWPCPTLRALASVYADHPDYRDEWRP